MCSKHAHVQSIVSRLNAGEHIAEVQLRGPSAHEPLICPVCKDPLRAARSRAPLAAARCAGRMRGWRRYTAINCMLLVAAVRCHGCGCACRVKAIHARSCKVKRLCTSHTVANRVGADAVGMRNTGSLIGKTGIVDVVKPLKENTHVRHVDLASNGLNEFGATQMAQVCPRRCGDPTRSVHSGQQDSNGEAGATCRC